MTQAVTFPRLSARTRNFSLGRPRGFRLSPDGLRATFLRSCGGTDPVTCLWSLDVATGAETLIADPLVVLSDGDDSETPEERARRERAREQAAGVVAYATDDALTVATFTLSGRLFRADVLAGVVAEIPTAGPVVDPRVDPTGRRTAYVTGGALHVLSDAGDAVLAVEEEAAVTWGLAEFVASEEMGRFRGYWWAPDGSAVVAARVDDSPVATWWIANPADPSSEPAEHRYPAAGTANADVGLRLFLLEAGNAVDVRWDADEFPYLVNVSWSPRGPLTLLVQSRDQRRMQVLTVDDVGECAVVLEPSDETWLEVVPGVPDWTAAGELVWVADDYTCETRRLYVDGRPVTPEGLQVEAVLGVDGDGIVLSASADPTEAHVHRWHDGTLEPIGDTGVSLSSGLARGGTSILVTTSLAAVARATVTRGDRVIEVPSYAEQVNVFPAVTLLRTGSRELRTAILWPSDRPLGALPVLMAPYGGPHANRVVAARSAYNSAQWWADQGFAVVIADGRGTPGRGPTWERAIARNLAGPVLDDQVDALAAVAAEHPGELDLDRVGIHGWSYGGYLAALAVLRRPDVFHAAAAGAPVTDWRLYDTHYTERYLGDPAASPEIYAQSSLLDDAERLERPLLLIHGLADDNVVAAHTLLLSAALLAAGRPHRVLPLTGVTHMTPQEVIAENLLLFELAFFREALSIG